jgi:hypothetical protein
MESHLRDNKRYRFLIGANHAIMGWKKQGACGSGISLILTPSSWAGEYQFHPDPHSYVLEKMEPTT